MKNFISHIFAASLVALLVNSAGAAGELDIPYTLHRLENGLTVVIHEDHKAPVVAVNIWYHVGSKNEVTGRTGFAHLFEHLMFQGSENMPDEYLNFLQKLGATDLNGTTWFDRTNYFQTVPVPALDTALFAESDRMGHFRATITQAVLDEQRGVVQNEKRQGDNEPYGRVFEVLLRQLFPPDHPYSWESIGSMKDLEAASLDDVRHWFDTYYGPNNAVLVIAGDVEPADALERVRKYFGDIPPGPPLTRYERWIPSHKQVRRQSMEDRVSQSRLYMGWTGPAWGTADAHQLQLAAAILAGDKNSRLYQRLVYRDQLASDVSLGAMAFEISGITYLQVSANPGVTLRQLETVVNEELDRFRREGPTRRELQRVRTQSRASLLRGLEKVGGFVGKAGILAESTVLGGSPDSWKQELRDTEAATPDDLRDVTRRWINDAPYVLEVTPAPEVRAVAGGVDRSVVPLPRDEAVVRFPSFERTRLGNGMELIVVERPGLPLVSLKLLLDAGFAADQFGRPGTANLGMAMLDEGTRTRDALVISEELALLGATLGTDSSLDSSALTMSALLDQLDPSLALFADVALNPVFPQNELERLRKVYLAALSQERTQPLSMALRVMPQLLYGEGHAYAQPLTGTGTEKTLRALTREDLVRFHETWFRPDHATLIAVGPVSVSMLKPKIEKLFGAWQPGPIPAKQLGDPASAGKGTLYLLDRPGADQSVIFAGQLLPPASVPDNLAIEAMNDVLGGKFTSRLNLNLRETKHWSYGARTFIPDARGPRPLLAYAPVQKDRTAESVAEVRREFAEIVSSRPPAADEVSVVRETNTLSLPGRWESGDAVRESVSTLVEYGLPDDYWLKYPDAVRALTTDEIGRAARDHLRPDQLVIVVVGDRAAVEPGLRKLGFNDIRLLDADGQPL
jgi:zinc protease